MIFSFAYKKSSMSMKCLIYDIFLSTFRLFMLQKHLRFLLSMNFIFLSMKYLYLWNVFFMKFLFLWNVSIYEMFFPWNVLSMKFLSMKCPSPFSSLPLQSYFSIHRFRFHNLYKFKNAKIVSRIILIIIWNWKARCEN